MLQNHLAESYWPADTSEPLLDATLCDMLRHAAAEVPQRVALVDAVVESARRRRVTYAQLLDLAERGARALLTRFNEGDRIAICSPNCAEWVFLQHAVSFARLVLVPINPAYRIAEIEVILRTSEAVGIFYVPQFRDNELESMLATLALQLPRLRARIKLENFYEFLEGGNPDVTLPRVESAAVLQIQFTSGTTGVPKGACLHHRGALNTSRFVGQRAGFPDGGVWLNSMPMFHIAGPVVTEIATLASRGTYVLAPHFDPALMLELIESEHANAMLVVPTMIIGLLDHPDFLTRSHESIQVVLTGAAVVPAALVQRTKHAFGCNLVILFGQTEVNGVVSQTSPNDSVDDQSATLGRPLPQVEVKISDPDTGHLMPLGMPGEICVRGYQVMYGYCGETEGSSEVIGSDGWLRTGDIASMDDRGYLRIAGRLKDMIIRGGMNVYPREIEDVLFDQESVAEVSVVGIPDEKWGEVIVAVIRAENPAAPPSPDALYALCRDRMAAHKSPAAWFFLDRFPLTPSGKIQKFILQQWISTGELNPVPWVKPTRLDRS